MDEKEIMVQIPISHYSKLVTSMAEYEVLLSILTASASLGYDGNTLKFDDEIIDKILVTLTPLSYRTAIRNLKNEREKSFEKARTIFSQDNDPGIIDCGSGAV